MGPLVDSFASAILDLVIVAISEELTTAEAGEGPDEVATGGAAGGAAGDGGKAKAVTQAMSLSDSAPLMETVLHGLISLSLSFVKQMNLFRLRCPSLVPFPCTACSAAGAAPCAM